MIIPRYWSHIVRITNIAEQTIATHIWKGVLMFLISPPRSDSMQPTLAYIPPIAIAMRAMLMVQSMESIPPLVIRASASSFPVSVAYP